MSTETSWNIGDTAYLSPVQINGKPEFFECPLLSGGVVQLPADTIKDHVEVKIHDIAGDIAKVVLKEIVLKEDVDRFYAEVQIKQLHKTPYETLRE